MNMRHTPIRKSTLVAMIAAAGLAAPALAQDASPAPKAKVSSSTTILKSDGNQSYEIKIENGKVTVFKLNGKDVDDDRYKLDEEGGFIVLKDGDEPVIIDIPHFDMTEFPAGFKGGIADWPPIEIAAPDMPAAPDAPDAIEWFDAPDAPEPPAAVAWVSEPPKVMIGIKHDEVSDEIREKLGLDAGEGVYVIETLKGLPADEAGIESGDVIIEVDGKRIQERNVLLEVLKKHKPGDDVHVIVIREGKKKKLKLELAPYSAERLGAPRALTLRSGEPGRFNIRINDEDMAFGEFEPFGDMDENDFFGEFDFDFDMEGLPPEAKQELERALKQAQKQAAEARVRAFTLRRDAQGQRELHELNRQELREHQDEIREQADRIRSQARVHADEMRRLEERLAKLRELGENDRLFRAEPDGRAFIIQRDTDEAREHADRAERVEREARDRSDAVVEKLRSVQRERDDLATRNRDLERRVDALERKLEEMVRRLESREDEIIKLLEKKD
ncbi:MAG: PDZ domain-containing protein [Phycisphaerales bacterium JB061]